MWYNATALTLAVLLAAVPFAEAVDEAGIITSGRASGFGSPNRGSVRIIGEFSTPALDLSSPSIQATIANMLLEDPGAGELADGLPITLFPRTRSRRVTVLETPAGTAPFVRLTVRTCIEDLEACPNATLGTEVGEYDFRLEAATISLTAPTQCTPAQPTTLLTTRFTINDGVNQVNVSIENHSWRCGFLGNRVNRIDTP